MLSEQRDAERGFLAASVSDVVVVSVSRRLLQGVVHHIVIFLHGRRLLEEIGHEKDLREKRED